MADSRTMYLYAAYPAPMPEDWLGWERCGPWGTPDYKSMALSWSYRPEWQIWARVSPAGRDLALQWIDRARSRGYYVVFPLAYAKSPRQAKAQGRTLVAALRYFKIRQSPRSLLARRKAMIRQFDRIPRPPIRTIPEDERGLTTTLPLFPTGFPEFDFPLVIPHAGREQFAAAMRKGVRHARGPLSVEERMKRAQSRQTRVVKGYRAGGPIL